MLVVAAHVSSMLNVNPTPLGYVSMSKIACEAIAVPYLPLCLPSCTLSKMGFGTDLVGICMGTSHPSTYLYSKTRKKTRGKANFFSKNFFILGISISIISIKNGHAHPAVIENCT